ncbi:MAG: 50S ribosomal protein L23 [Mycoplasmataceae bacterium]|jgi:large subunit ribosomal protein L23|nr:50S ribosomal protein L23 [Mycoplasmataceae bacterium]
MDFTRIILRPMHTEKIYAMQNNDPKKIAFEVDPKASKQMIKIAFGSIYGILPTKIATQIRKPVKVRKGTAKSGYSKLLKIAYVTLPKGTHFDLNNQQEENIVPSVEEKKVNVDVKKKETTNTKTVDVDNLPPIAAKKEIPVSEKKEVKKGDKK